MLKMRPRLPLPRLSTLVGLLTTLKVLRLTLLPLLKDAERDGLLELSAHTIRPSLRGRRFLNLLIERFL